jgi:hypothetical protein
VDGSAVNGSGPVKREKKAPMNPYKAIVDKIAAEVSTEFQPSDESPYISVSTGLIQELLSLASA